MVKRFKRLYFVIAKFLTCRSGELSYNLIIVILDCEHNLTGFFQTRIQYLAALVKQFLAAYFLYVPYFPTYLSQGMTVFSRSSHIEHSLYEQNFQMFSQKTSHIFGGGGGDLGQGEFPLSPPCAKEKWLQLNIRLKSQEKP